MSTRAVNEEKAGVDVLRRPFRLRVSRLQQNSPLPGMWRNLGRAPTMIGWCDFDEYVLKDFRMRKDVMRFGRRLHARGTFDADPTSNPGQN